MRPRGPFSEGSAPSSGANALVAITGPITLISICRRKSATGNSSRGPETAMPALLTRPARVSPLSALRTSWAAALTADSSVTSNTSGRKLAASSAFTRSASACLRTLPNTRKPCPISTFAAAWPMPVDVPVMTTDRMFCFPVSAPAVLLPVLEHGKSHARTREDAHERQRALSPCTCGVEKQSSSSSLPSGLLRGACHRARIRATRWLAMTWRVRSERSSSSLREASATKQSSLFALPLDCGTSHRARIRATRWLDQSDSFVRRGRACATAHDDSHRWESLSDLILRSGLLAASRSLILRSAPLRASRRMDASPYVASILRDARPASPSALPEERAPQDEASRRVLRKLLGMRPAFFQGSVDKSSENRLTGPVNRGVFIKVICFA